MRRPKISLNYGGALVPGRVPQPSPTSGGSPRTVFAARRRPLPESGCAAPRRARTATAPHHLSPGCGAALPAAWPPPDATPIARELPGIDRTACTQSRRRRGRGRREADASRPRPSLLRLSLASARPRRGWSRSSSRSRSRRTVVPASASSSSDSTTAWIALRACGLRSGAASQSRRISAVQTSEPRTSRSTCRTASFAVAPDTTTRKPQPGRRPSWVSRRPLTQTDASLDLRGPRPTLEEDECR